MDYFRHAISAAFQLIFSFDPDVYHAVWTSLRIAVSATVLAAAVGVPLGALIALRLFRGRHLVQLGLNTLMALPTVVVGLFFYAFLRREGLVGGLNLLYTPAGIVVGEFILGLPIVVNLTVAALRGLDPRLLPTCRALGATPLQEAAMALREGRFAVMAAVVAAFGRLIGEVGVAMMLGGNIKGFTRTMTTAIALETSKGEFELGLALGLLLLLVALAANVALHRLQAGRGEGRAAT